MIIEYFKEKMNIRREITSFRVMRVMKKLMGKEILEEQRAIEVEKTSRKCWTREGNRIRRSE